MKTAVVTAVTLFTIFSAGAQNNVKTPVKPATTTLREVIMMTNDVRGYDYIADATTKELIKVLPYKESFKFNEGLAAVESSTGFGFINTKGIEVVPPDGKYQWAGSFSSGLAPIGTKDENGNKKSAGFINKSGQLVIPLIYQDARKFSEGLAAVKKNGKWGFINKSGTMVIPAVYDFAGSFSRDLAEVAKLEKDEDGYESAKWGYIDKKNNLVIPFKYDETKEFRNTGPNIDEALVSYDDKLYFIDKEGNEYDQLMGMEANELLTSLEWADESGDDVLVSTYKNYQHFKGVYSCFWAGFKVKPIYSDLLRVIDPYSKKVFYKVQNYSGVGMVFQRDIMIPAVFTLIDFLDSVIYAVYDAQFDENNQLTKGKYSLFNSDLEQLTPYTYKESYDYISGFSEGLAVVRKDSMTGFINRKGEEVIPLNYEDASPFQSGLALVLLNKKVGAINKKGEIVIATDYEYLENFNNGYSIYMLNGLMGIIDSTGNKITEPIYKHLSNLSEGMISYQNDTTVGFINIRGEVCIPDTLKAVSKFSDGLAQVLSDNQKIGYINKKGVMVIPPVYDSAEDFLMGYARVVEKEKMYLIDKKGKIVKVYPQ